MSPGYPYNWVNWSTLKFSDGINGQCVCMPCVGVAFTHDKFYLVNLACMISLLVKRIKSGER